MASFNLGDRIIHVTSMKGDNLSYYVEFTKEDALDAFQKQMLGAAPEDRRNPAFFVTTTSKMAVRLARRGIYLRGNPNLVNAALRDAGINVA